MWVQHAFDALWEGDTDRDRLVANLDVADADGLARVLDESLEAVTRHTFTFSEWARYKYELLKSEAAWGETMFVWAPRDLQRPWPYVDVDRDALRAIRTQDEKLWRRAIFVLWMALQNPPAPGLQTPSIWNLIGP